MILHSIDFATRPLMEKLYHQYGHGSSAMHFSSLYVWRNEMQLSVYLQPDLFAVKAGWRGQNYWFFPCGKEQAKKEFLLSLAAHPSYLGCLGSRKKSPMRITERLSLTISPAIAVKSNVIASWVARIHCRLVRNISTRGAQSGLIDHGSILRLVQRAP